MKRLCIYCQNPLKPGKGKRVKSHLVCHKREVTRRMKEPVDPNRRRRLKRWLAERAEAERAMKAIRKEES